MRLNLVVDEYYNESYEALADRLERIGAKVSKSNYDMTVFVGGDGTFSDNVIDFIDRPVLFLTKRKRTTDISVAYNAEGYVEDIGAIISSINSNDIRISEEPILCAEYKKRTYRTAYDFFVERQSTKEAIRYSMVSKDSSRVCKTFAISNGFIVTTALGSTGYFSYIDVLMGRRKTKISGIGVCHILPVKIYCSINGAPAKQVLRYIGGVKMTVKAEIKRSANQMLFGMSGSEGVQVDEDEPISFHVDKRLKLKLVQLPRKFKPLRR
ncbi:hypothetical protein M1373_01155 [Candidatus Marsarchaeota archaeon]|nr:hypothetical protein [Candidatus Marsarchaeota archaeon]MCL5404907.1 hypothetical protein [Candidatus Marsarchaeota archaeon]